MAILGYNTQGGTTYANNAQSTNACHDTTDGTGGDTNQLHIWVTNTSGTNHIIEIGIYSDDAANGCPLSLLASAVTIDIANGFDGQKDVAYVVTLAASTKYWIAIGANNDTGAAPYYDTADAGRHAFINTTVGALATNWDELNDAVNTTRWSMWATYGATAGASAAPKLMSMYRRRRA